MLIVVPPRSPNLKNLQYIVSLTNSKRATREGIVLGAWTVTPYDAKQIQTSA